MSGAVIHWFRRDLRLGDNLALHEAIKSGAPVIPVFVFDPAILKSERSGAPRMALLLKALDALDGELRGYGKGLLVRTGDPLDVLPSLVAESRAQAVFLNRDYSPFAVRRDNALAERLPIPVHAFDDAMLMPPSHIVKSDGRPYTVYTPYKNNWRKQQKPSISTLELNSSHFHNLTGLNGQDLPTLAELGFKSSVETPQVGEAAALQKLDAFVAQDIFTYREDRNRLPIDPFAAERPVGSSFLSPYFRLGMLSPRQAYWAAREAYERAPNETSRESVSTWVDELIWREFYMQILANFPHVNTDNFRPEYNALDWRHAPEELQAWQEGQTGYPIVDAAMRQMNTVGWMPNRARMIVASFLCKDLLIHWKEGERYFMQRLFDGDPAANNGGWQWAAGTGTDAQPYFRIFNPVSQSQKFDPDGTYIRHFVPELQAVSAKFIHAPWEMDSPPKGYPAPMVDHSAARERTLAAFKAVKAGEAEAHY
ncbi:MAG: deoxyribodipyrimidine photo-lyase [bacterium]|nr:deoxyribodipyrimidine photo-lyase [bacterium]